MESANEAIEFARRVFELIDRTRTVSTYKLALLLALIDCCQEGFDERGAAPGMVTTRQVARRVLELYWHQARIYDEQQCVLLQNNGSQAEVLTRIGRFRREHANVTSSYVAERREPMAFARLLNHVEWKLIEMPIPRLHTMGTVSGEPLIYDIHWSKGIRKRASGISAYQQAYLEAVSEYGHADLLDLLDGGDFDNRIRLGDGVGDYLVWLAPLLRPIIQREWTRLVAHFNDVKTHRIEEFLFGPERSDLSGLREPLRELQEGRCFYCDAAIRGSAEVDHFIAWARCPNDDLHNLVLAHGTCNLGKSDHLAGVNHLQRWIKRFEPGSALNDEIRSVADDIQWPASESRSLNIARAIYLPVPPDTPLWARGKQIFEPAKPSEIRDVLASVA